ncbi:MAG TPA: ribbon-helix-helix protein, CopG family [Vicinamibacteria bacterium]
MRTTITIDDALLEDLKNRAAERGTTVSRLIEDSVRFAAARPRAAESGELKLVTYGQGGRFTRLDVNKTSGLLEAEDLERYGRRNR